MTRQEDKGWRRESHVPSLFSWEPYFPEDNQGEQLRGQGVQRQCGGVKGQREAGAARVSIHGEVSQGPYAR